MGWSREKRYKQIKDLKQKARMRVLRHYGGNPPACACCGELLVELLTMDHVEAVEAIHNSQKRDGSDLCFWIIKHHYPTGFQVLCFNCNQAKGIYGICPHQKELNLTIGDC